ncbi:MAG: sugar phosphate isomerase/epimerase [Gammaproteobacteria bacterium]|nr:sugar phosphate isomerase/epimerase [Gammaproteobacteria bacterium]
MQVGIMSGTFARPSLGETLDAILDHDIRHMQFNWGSAHPPGPLAQVIDAICPVIREETAKRDMVIAAVAGNINMADADPAKRQQGIERLRMVIGACKSVGTSVVATCTGSRHPDSMWRHHPDNASPEAWRDVCATLEQVLPTAEAAGVMVAFEPEINNVASDAVKSRRLIDDMGSPNLKVVMDAANIFGKDDLPRMREVLDEAFDLLGDHVAIAHGKDLDHGGDAGHLAAGTGKLDYAHYVSLLCGLSFDVPIILHGLTEAQVEASAGMLRRHAAAHQAVSE